MPKLDGFSLSLAIVSAVIYITPQAQANEVIAYKDYQFSCGQSNFQKKTFTHNCQDIFQLFEAKIYNQKSDFIFQSKINNLKYQQSASQNTGIADYLVSTILGVYFPTLETLKANGGSFFGGIKIRENMRLDAEIVGIFGGNTVEEAYFDLSTFLSLRFFLPFSVLKSRSLFYISPGIGISELDDEKETDEDEDTRPTWQLESGIAIPINRSLGGYVGLKYADQLSEDGSNVFGAECGLTLGL